MHVHAYTYGCARRARDLLAARASHGAPLPISPTSPHASPSAAPAVPQLDVTQQLGRDLFERVEKDNRKRRLSS